MALMIYSIFKRNLKMMFNSKLSFLILLFGPLFLVFVTGAILQDDSSKTMVAGLVMHEENGDVVYSQDDFYSSFSKRLQEHSFSVRQDYSVYDCRRKVIDGDYSVCIEVVRKIPPDLLGQTIRADYNYEVINHVDISRARTSGEVVGKVQLAVDSYAQELIRSSLLDARNELESVIGSLEEVRGRMNLAISALNALDSKLIILEDELAAIDNSVSNLENEIDLMIGDIDALISYVESIDEEEFYTNYILGDLYTLRNNLQVAQNSMHGIKNKVQLGTFSRNFAGDARNTVRDVRDDLVFARDQIDTVLIEWDRISEEDLRTLANPIEFSTAPISGLSPPLLQPTNFKNLGKAIDPKAGIVQSNKDLRFFDYIFSSFLMFFIIFVSMLLSTVTIIRERSSNAYIRNTTSKTSGFSFIFGNYLSLVFVLFFQILIMLVISAFFLRVNVIGNLGLVLFYSLFAVSLFTLFGMAIGHIFSSQESAVIASISLSLLFVLFLPIITPTESLPSVLAFFFSLAPFVIFETKLKLITLFNLVSGFSILEIFSLFVSYIGAGSLLAFFYYFNKRKEI